jgi:hypothetical protein
MRSLNLIPTLLLTALAGTAACAKQNSLGAGAEDTSDGATTQAGASTGEVPEDTEGVDCPADAMICPDGSTVGRSGPDCTFDPCSTDVTTTDGDDTGTGTGDSEPICPPDSAYLEAATCSEPGGYEIDPGCYQACDIENPSCDEQSTCFNVEINPCACDDGEDCCAACAAQTALCIPIALGEACEAIIGGTFASVEELECGENLDGLQFCNWSLTFGADGRYDWFYSDIAEEGGYVCKDGVIITERGFELSASYDATTGILSWDGVDYVAAR